MSELDPVPHNDEPAVDQPIADSPAAAPPGSRAAGETPQRRKLLLLLGLLVVLVGITAGGVVYFLKGGLTKNSGAEQAALATATVSPPPAWNASLAAPRPNELAGDGASTAQTLAQIPLLANALAANLATVSDGKAPASQIILPGGRQVREGDVGQEIPRYLRWEIKFGSGNTLESYARQLDFFKIELGIIGGGDQVQYLYVLSNAVPSSHSGPPGDDQRLYLTWKRGALRELDEQFAARAKVSLEGKVIAHFYPPNVEQQLADLEDDYALKHQIAKIRKTVFGVQPDEKKGFKFYVIDQQADER